MRNQVLLPTRVLVSAYSENRKWWDPICCLTLGNTEARDGRVCDLWKHKLVVKGLNTMERGNEGWLIGVVLVSVLTVAVFAPVLRNHLCIPLCRIVTATVGNLEAF
jgi:hypothetical protein